MFFSISLEACENTKKYFLGDINYQHYPEKALMKPLFCIPVLPSHSS